MASVHYSHKHRGWKVEGGEVVRFFSETVMQSLDEQRREAWLIADLLDRGIQGQRIDGSPPPAVPVTDDWAEVPRP